MGRIARAAIEIKMLAYVVRNIDHYLSLVFKRMKLQRELNEHLELRAPTSIHLRSVANILPPNHHPQAVVVPSLVPYLLRYDKRVTRLACNAIQ